MCDKNNIFAHKNHPTQRDIFKEKPYASRRAFDRRYIYSSLIGQYQNCYFGNALKVDSVSILYDPPFKNVVCRHHKFLRVCFLLCGS